MKRFNTCVLFLSIIAEREERKETRGRLKFFRKTPTDLAVVQNKNRPLALRARWEGGEEEQHNLSLFNLLSAQDANDARKTENTR